MTLEFDRIIEQLNLESLRMANKFGPKSDNLTGPNSIDIDGFIEVLYLLLESNNYLLKEGDSPSPNKFLLSEEYPDIEADNRDMVTFEIHKRSPACLSSNEGPFSGTKYYRPLFLGVEKDEHSGDRIVHLQSMYDNRLRFKCWSTKTSQARKLASLLESILVRHYYTLRKYVPVLLYEGRSDGGNTTNEHGSNRYHGISLDMFIRTNERLTLKEQEIVCFEHSIQLQNK
jgi:hypothetical protein